MMLWAWFILAGLVGSVVYGWAIIIDGAARAREQEREANEWARLNGWDLPYPERESE